MTHASISGIIPPLVTPLTDRLDLDTDAFGKLIDHVIEGGAAGIFLLGTTGEGPSLDPEVQQQVIDAGVQLASGRVPLLINISSTSYLEVIGMAEKAAAAGADFVVLTPPYYFNMDQQELTRYYKVVADRISIPMLLYNAPHYTKTAIEIPTVWELASHNHIIGIKDSSGDLEYIQALSEGRGTHEFPIFIGPELLLEKSVQWGCNGGVCGGANLFPRLFVEYFHSAITNNKEGIEKCQKLLEKIDRIVYRATESPMSIVIGIKSLLSLKGIGSAQMALPVYDKPSQNQIDTMEELNREMASHGY